MKLTSKKTILCCILAFILLTVFGASMAVLVHNTESRSNIVTVGTAEIELKEPLWEALENDEKIVYPLRQIPKNPFVTNNGSTGLYVYLKLSVPAGEIRVVTGNTQIEERRLQALFTYSVNEGWTQLGEDALSADKKYIERVYAYTQNSLAAGSSTGSLFDSVEFVNMVEGDLSGGTAIDMPIEAIAIQADYLNESGNTTAEKIINAYEIYSAQSG